MNIHEFQAKKILADFGVNIPRGREAHSVTEAISVAKDIGGKKWVVKAQIHAGGRGKAGGVKIAETIKEVEDISNIIFYITCVIKIGIISFRCSDIFKLFNLFFKLSITILFWFFLLKCFSLAC